MDAIEVLKTNKKDLENRYGLKSIGVFGSFARGEQKKRSDVDILVEFKKTVDIFEFIEVKEHLEVLLDRKVDLVTRNALKPYIKDRILSEVIYV